MSRIVSLALVILFACAAPRQTLLRLPHLFPTPGTAHRAETITFGFSSAFPMDRRAEARDGFYYWNGLLGRALFREVDLEPAVTLYLNSTPCPLDTDKMLIYATSAITVVTFFPIWNSTDTVTRESVARHEVGHVLGLDHSGSHTQCLMNSWIATGEKAPRTACPDEIADVIAEYGSGP